MCTSSESAGIKNKPIIILDVRNPMNKCDPRERASKVVSLAFSKLYYACVVDDSGDRTVS